MHVKIYAKKWEQWHNSMLIHAILQWERSEMNRDERMVWACEKMKKIKKKSTIFMILNKVLPYIISIFDNKNFKKKNKSNYEYLVR